MNDIGDLDRIDILLIDACDDLRYVLRHLPDHLTIAPARIEMALETLGKVRNEIRQLELPKEVIPDAT